MPTELKPALLFTLVALLVLGILHGGLWLAKDRSRRHALPRGLLREPGRADTHWLEWLSYRSFVAAFSLPALGLVWYAMYHQLLPAEERTWPLAGLVLAGLVALAWNVQELVRLVPLALRLRQSVGAQKLTAQLLNQLMRQEYWVFHDLHLKNQQIHHLVMGRRGVFVVESLGRRPRAKWRRQWPWGWETPPAEAQFDGRALHLAGDDETAVVEQVRTKARVLASELSAAAGELVTVHAALAMPGWRVQATDWSNVIVFNPTAPKLLIEGGRDGVRLDPSDARGLVRYLKEAHSDPHSAGGARRKPPGRARRKRTAAAETEAAAQR